jgi:isopropylmalate/homocitrate/citramalate synthase
MRRASPDGAPLSDSQLALGDVVPRKGRLAADRTAVPAGLAWRRRGGCGGQASTVSLTCGDRVAMMGLQCNAPELQSGGASIGGEPVSRIYFLDVTNRDGVQTARINLSKFGKTMVNWYLGKLGVYQSEMGFPFVFHEVPYIRANVALAKAGAFENLKLSGWTRAVVGDVEKSKDLGLEHMNLSISTSDQMIRNKFRGRLDRGAVISEMVAAAKAARDIGVKTLGVNAEDGSRTDDGYLLEFTQAAKDAGADRVRYCDTIGGDSPQRIRERFATIAAEISLPVETHCHNDLGMAVANSVAGALGDLDAGQDAYVNTCINGIGERSGNADLLSCILAFRHSFGVSEGVEIGDPIDLSWARRFGLWASYALGQPLPLNQPGVGRNVFSHESGIHADGALKDRHNYELYDDATLGPFPKNHVDTEGRVVLTGEYGGKAGFRHVMDAIDVQVKPEDEDLVFRLVQVTNAANGRPLHDDELRLLAAYPHELALLYPGLI